MHCRLRGRPRAFGRPVGTTLKLDFNGRRADGRALTFQHVPAPDLAVALVDATSLARPVRTPRWLQPTLNYFRGGFLRQLSSRWREQPHLVARWCRLLRLAGRHLILPPSNPLHSMKEMFILPGEGTPIHSTRGHLLPPWKQTRCK